MKAEVAEGNMEELHELHDLEAMEMEAQAMKEAAENARVSQHQMTITSKLRELGSRSEKMRRAEAQMKQQIEADRQQFEREKQDAKRLLEEVNGLAQVHADLQCKQRDEQKKIISAKHEDENKALKIAVENQTMQLMERQQLEIEMQDLLETEKSSEMDKERIAELESELECAIDQVNALQMKERVANDQLEVAREAACQVLDMYGSEDRIGLRKMGCIDKRPWVAACKKKFQHDADGGHLVMSAMIEEWEDRITESPHYYPFKNVQLQGDKWKQVVDEGDEHMKKLKEDWGPEVMQTVVNAFLEIDEYSACGRQPVVVAWDFEKNERVHLKDLLFYLRDLLDSSKPAEAERKRRTPRAAGKPTRFVS